MRKSAILIRDERFDFPDGLIVQIKIWKLPYSTTERPHGLKYSLFFGRRGERIIGYDNEAGKGDHRHYRHQEEPYAFRSMVVLVEDFLADIRREMKGSRS
ncbi:DUF6516 family protein [Phyllobacterium sp. OV277]|uniref:toxin-antitoxin system TumE family protein n=1 Tax=Phyllobacterium sp. OV277 TaxID=1882772 RepID=UPI000B8083A7|nr:DUF6516 family protein [Phyllobacterium sp. OV277]